METPRKPLSKYWCSVTHYLSDIRNIYIKADRFPLMMLTAQIKKENKFNYKEGIVSALIGVFVVYIDTGSSMPISPSKSRDLADENNKIVT
jgi:hypothetical protein